MTSTSDKILQTIQENKLAPAPRWKFLAANAALWISFTIVMAISAFSISTILDLVVGHDWDLYPHMHKSFSQYLFLSMPYLWILSLLLFVLIAYYNFTHIKGWYRHRIHRVIAVGTGLSIALGLAGFYLGIGSVIDDFFASNVPFYKVINQATKKSVWDRPEEGLLGGRIVNIDSEKEFELQDLEGNRWVVINEAPIVKSVEIEEGENVKIIGRKLDKSTFSAQEIRDWEPHEMRKTLLPKSKQASPDLCTKPEIPCGK